MFLGGVDVAWCFDVYDDNDVSSACEYVLVAVLDTRCSEHRT